MENIRSQSKEVKACFYYATIQTHLNCSILPDAALIEDIDFKDMRNNLFTIRAPAFAPPYEIKLIEGFHLYDTEGKPFQFKRIGNDITDLEGNLLIQGA